MTEINKTENSVICKFCSNSIFNKWKNKMCMYKGDHYTNVARQLFYKNN